MKEFINYEEIYTQLTWVSDFNETTGLYLYRPDNLLFILKKEDLSAKPIYKTLMTISNPHLARVLYIAEREDHLDILEEYISGDSIDRFLSVNGTLSVKEAKQICSDICDGLLAMHRKGLIHRDITPNNIILHPTGAATIIDYGITRLYSIRKNTDTTILGTPGYAAPEQFGFSQSDTRTDIYAVGVLFNVMLTGKLPNEKKASGAYGKIIGKCIEIDSEKRYISMEALSEALRHTSTADGPADKLIRIIPGLRSRHIPVVILSLLVYAFIGILTSAIFGSRPPDSLIATTVSWCLMLPIPFFCFTNFLGIWDILPFSKDSSKRNQAILYTIIGIFSFLIGLSIFAAINQT